MTMTKLSYWERRQLRVKARQLDNTAQLERTIQSELARTYRDIAKEASMWVDKYAKNQGLNSEQAMRAISGIKTKNWQMTMKQFEAKAKQGGYDDELNAEYYRSRLSRLSALESQMKQMMQPIVQQHSKSVGSALANQYNDTYMRTMFNTQAQQGSFTSDFAHFNETQLKIIASEPWGKDGKDFSKRIWKNYQQELPSYLTDSLFRATVMGWGPDKVARMMHAQFQDVQRNKIHNLVTSEMGHMAEEATAKSYEESGIDEYEYMATLESHTCDACARLDGQHFKMFERKVGINYPLIHPRCRCTTVPYIADLPDVGERWMRDPATGKGKLIKNVKFDEWKKMTDYPSAAIKTTPINSTFTNAIFNSNRVTIDVENASHDELVKVIQDDFGMELSETSRTKLSDTALRQTVKTVTRFKDLYDVLPNKIPVLRALTASKGGQAVAWYSHYVNGERKPIEFALNVKYFKNLDGLQNMVQRNVDSGWFSNNNEPNHVMIHEFSHHIDGQLSVLNGGQDFSNKLFMQIKKENPDFKVANIGRYAYKSYLKSHRYTEPFAELFAEAYGPTPGRQARVFKKYFEKMSLEVLNDARSTKGN